MSAIAGILLIERDAPTVELFRATVGIEPRVKLTVALNLADAARMARDQKPAMIVISSDLPGANVFAFCQQLRQDAATKDAVIVLVIPAGANDLRFAGLTFGVDEYLPRPVEASDILTRIHSMLRLKQVADQVDVDKAELESLHEHLRASFDQLLQLMVRMLDMRLPGAADRGQRIADLALKIANRFGVPRTHLRDLEIAARLHELGRVVSHEDKVTSMPSVRAVDDWQYILPTRAIFAKVEGLAGATELVGSMYENWDGTGHPDHQMQGQIPLRSRILRLLVDLFAELDAPDHPTMEAVLEDLQNHVGTRYDPMVMVHLRAVLSGADEGDVQGRHLFVPVTELRVGMVLAEDLITDAGIKLLARGTRITAATLEVIHRRNALEPIVQGAAVVRPER